MLSLVFDKSRYIHNAFGMNEPGAYVCRPDGIIASRTKNANFEHVFDTFIQKSLRLRTNESSAMRESA
ncbi:hypothetical protein [Pseudoalteromonas xiamenensis]|uniref:Uncharacterized protein n=1 Tax=Pseudoalteromonas xiamenensis TaxID=882626 RepID=A0A975DF48_9GAMM|nr:hypothetical protein [Pseudoalteromonas xiamenensis]QTH70515.1 hypothetical protein J5O05_11105 [Pseudoalteromonas xiamenensis]